MSVNFNVSEILNAILHRHVEQEAAAPALSEQQLLLVECYRSGQIDESAWQEHLEEDEELAAYFREPPVRRALH